MSFKAKKNHFHFIRRRSITNLSSIWSSITRKLAQNQLSGDTSFLFLFLPFFHKDVFVYCFRPEFKYGARKDMW
ncbi:hypothetical protein HanPSC8_Chr10g0423651 [Helianthus annuus]|nr:hypothetical protein HanPSC8_Chr10g0423651 [Helianthus annuus]